MLVAAPTAVAVQSPGIVVENGVSYRVDPGGATSGYMFVATDMSAEREAARLNVSLLGQIPIDIATRDVDTPLSALGVRQARALGHWFGPRGGDDERWAAWHRGEHPGRAPGGDLAGPDATDALHASPDGPTWRARSTRFGKS